MSGGFKCPVLNCYVLQGWLSPQTPWESHNGLVLKNVLAILCCYSQLKWQNPELKTQQKFKNPHEILLFYWPIPPGGEGNMFILFVLVAPGPPIIASLAVLDLEERLLTHGKQNDKRDFLPVRRKLLTLSLRRKN